MTGCRHFKRIGHRQTVHKEVDQPHCETFLTLLRDRVVERFARFTGLNVLAVPMDLPGREAAEDPPSAPAHPACAEFEGNDYCRESWQLHLAELQRLSEPLWHKCEYGRLCALVPVIRGGRCLAAIKLVASDSEALDTFERNVELLKDLVQNLLASETDLLDRLLTRDAATGEPEVSPSCCDDPPIQESPKHPQVLKALDHVEKHFADPKLTVGRIARELDIHADYLAHLFARQIGQRMSRYIAARRIELAKNLLATTDWQIKRVAHETGHANPNWFSHVFSDHTGLTPSDYRRKNLSL